VTPRPAFFAAGNNGLFPQDELLTLVGYYGLMVNFKDLLVVGSVESNDAEHSDTSSLGPTLDGRLKPDVVAPGSSDLRPLAGFEVQVGELRLHARPSSGAPDRVWRWGAPGGWVGAGGLNPNDPERPARVSPGVLSGFTYGGSWQTRVQWTAGAPPPEAPIEAALYEALSVELRSTLPPAPPAGDPLNPDRPPLPATHELPGFLQLRYGDGVGEGFDDALYFAYGEPLRSGEWRRVRLPLDAPSWAGEVHRLRLTPGLYLGGVYAPSLSGGYELASGTSMASPAAAGVAALALEQLAAQGRYDLAAAPPPPAALRALMTHTARDLARAPEAARAAWNPDTQARGEYGAGPDWSTGYGLVDAVALSALIAADAAAPRWREGVAAPGEVQVFALEVTGAGPLKVTLAWDDPAGSALTAHWAPKLIHDLDLAVLGPDGAAYGPWVLTPPPLHAERYEGGEDEFSAGFVLPAARCRRGGLEALWSGAPREGLSAAPDDVDPLGFAPRLNRGCVDELNPQEQVRLDAPRPGRYEVVVRGPRAGGAPQPFTLVWSQGCAWDISDPAPARAPSRAP